jgi:pyruvate carboxylase subunit B
MRYIVTLEGSTHEVHIDGDTVLLDGEPVEATITRVEGTPLHALRIGTRSHRVIAERDGDGIWRMDVGGRPARADVVDERTHRLREMAGAAAGAEGPRPIKAPMPGLVVKVEVEVGEVVDAGQGIVIVEAMKMENELDAEIAARVSAIRVAAGDTVEKDQVLVEFEPLEEDG